MVPRLLLVLSKNQLFKFDVLLHTLDVPYKYVLEK